MLVHPLPGVLVRRRIDPVRWQVGPTPTAARVPREGCVLLVHWLLIALAADSRPRVPVRGAALRFWGYAAALGVPVL